MDTVTCVRCRQQREAARQVPHSGALGDQIRQQVCNTCWTEWQQAEVMVINELRLDFMDPRSHDILLQQMREFLALGAETPPSP